MNLAVSMCIEKIVFLKTFNPSLQNAASGEGKNNIIFISVFFRQITW